MHVDVDEERVLFCTRVCKHFRNSNSKSSNGRLPLRENLTRI